jgi:hypothetical protein
MIPLIQQGIGVMDDALIVLAFGALFSKRMRAFINGQFVSSAKKIDLNKVEQTIQGVAHDKNGNFVLKTYVQQNGAWTERVEIEFDTKQARKAVETIEQQRRSLDKKENADYRRVLMRLTRSDIRDAEIGKRSGDMALIEEIQSKPLPIMYGSELAEERLKDEIRDHASVYYKAFVVDVNVQKSNGRNIVYSITHVHQVIELPDDSNPDI